MANVNPVQKLRFTASENAVLTLPAGVIVFLTDTKQTRIHDGVTAGGVIACHPSVAICTYEQPSGSSGGSASTGSWIDLPISTESADPDNIVSLSGDNIVLGAGKYVVEWDSIFHSTNASQTRLKVYNGSTSTYVYGSVVECKSTSYVSAASTGKAYFELTPGGYITLQYRVATAVATYGLGVGASFGNVNVFRTVQITKLS